MDRHHALAASRRFLPAQRPLSTTIRVVCKRKLRDARWPRVSEPLYSTPEKRRAKFKKLLTPILKHVHDADPVRTPGAPSF